MPNSIKSMGIKIRALEEQKKMLEKMYRENISFFDSSGNRFRIERTWREEEPFSIYLFIGNDRFELGGMSYRMIYREFVNGYHKILKKKQKLSEQEFLKLLYEERSDILYIFNLPDRSNFNKRLLIVAESDQYFMVKTDRVPSGIGETIPKNSEEFQIIYEWLYEIYEEGK